MTGWTWSSNCRDHVLGPLDEVAGTLDATLEALHELRAAHDGTAAGAAAVAAGLPVLVRRLLAAAATAVHARRLAEEHAFSDRLRALPAIEEHHGRTGDQAAAFEDEAARRFPCSDGRVPLVFAELPGLIDRAREMVTWLSVRGYKPREAGGAMHCLLDLRDATLLVLGAAEAYGERNQLGWDAVAVVARALESYAPLGAAVAAARRELAWAARDSA